MNRKEQIENAAQKYFESIPEHQHGTVVGFQMGAEWADENRPDCDHPPQSAKLNGYTMTYMCADCGQWVKPAKFVKA